MNWKIHILTAVLLLPAVFGRRGTGQEATAVNFRDNQCIACHERLTEPLRAVDRFFEWHTSLHRAREIGCEQCHGGNAATNDKQRAHLGVTPPRDRASRLYDRNLPRTCGGCHQSVVNAFVESEHHRKLQGSGLGPSCSTCHLHMASEVIYTPEATAGLCARCHDSIGMLQPRPEIPAAAADAMRALRRADSAVALADQVLNAARDRRLDVANGERELSDIHIMLAETKVSWHAFNLEAVRRKADAAFNTAFRFHAEWRDRLRRRY